MINSFIESQGRVQSFKWVSGLLLFLTLAVFSEGCSKGPAGNERADKNTNSRNANQQDQAAAAQPLLQQTIKGDIERTSLAIWTAREAVKANQWQDASAQLQNARKGVEAALARQPSLRDDFEALKAAIDRAIAAVESRGKDAEGRVTELQTRIGTLKVQTGQ